MNDEKVILVMVSVAAVVVVVLATIAGGVIRSVLKTREKERSRREVAAYVAEGSMTSDEGAKLLDAGRPAWERELWHKRG